MNEKLSHLWTKVTAIFATDKLIHASACFIIAALAGAITIKTQKVGHAFWVAPLVAMVIGGLKELADEIRYQGADWRDIVADAVGAILGTLYLLFLI